jgi:hypothetical protein
VKLMKPLGATLLASTFIAALWLYVRSSEHYKNASSVIESSAMRSVAGTVNFSVLTAFRVTGSPVSRSRFSFFVSGSKQSGWLVVVIEERDGALSESAEFSGKQLELSSPIQR